MMLDLLAAQIKQERSALRIFHHHFRSFQARVSETEREGNSEKDEDED